MPDFMTWLMATSPWVAVTLGVTAAIITGIARFLFVAWKEFRNLTDGLIEFLREQKELEREREQQQRQYERERDDKYFGFIRETEERSRESDERSRNWIEAVIRNLSAGLGEVSIKTDRIIEGQARMEDEIKSELRTLSDSSGQVQATLDTVIKLAFKNGKCKDDD